MELTLHARPESEAEPDIHFAPKDRPVDLAHLSRYTMGNSVLEREVLELFRRQTRLYFDKLSMAKSDDSWREAARVLKASARSVGAWQILETADMAETLAFSRAAPARQELLRALDAQILDAYAFIDSVL
ncbi:MAG: Hpt domain-containing protein [Rhodomicrobium sp.]|nr:Hpt domain-containing protein [Rhodomicrobium sp.]